MSFSIKILREREYSTTIHWLLMTLRQFVFQKKRRNEMKDSILREKKKAKLEKYVQTENMVSSLY